MVIDTSAIIAVLFNEANAARVVQAIEAGSPLPLLYQGNDFRQTEIAGVSLPPASI
jgi:uncharacterized protein with PIN domain